MNLFKDVNDLPAAKEVFERDGFCVFTDLLRPAEVEALRKGVDQALADGKLSMRDKGMTVNDDAIYADPAIEAACKYPALVNVAEALIGHAVELQHAKFNAKPKQDKTIASEVAWHQDFPFFSAYEL